MTEDEQLDVDQQRQMVKDLENENKRREEALANFPLVLDPYDDRDVLDDLQDLIKNPAQDFKFIVHAHLLSLGAAEGWDMDILKAAVKETLNLKDIKDVDRKVQEEFKCATFKQFIRKTPEIAVVDENGRVHPNLDDDENRQSYEDAMASSKNKDEKERKHDEQIAKKLEEPENVEGFYRGVNRLRRAIREAIIVHGSKDNSITEINAMDGSGDILDAINYNHVMTEYQNLYDKRLDKEECKRICNRSTLMKGLTKGEGASCFIESFAMENKEKGMFIAVKNNAREYTEADIRAEVEKCKQARAQADKKIKKWQDKDSRPSYSPRVPAEKSPQDKEKAERQKRMLSQMEKQALPVSSEPETSGPPAPSVPTSSEPPAVFAQPPKNGPDYLRLKTGGCTGFGGFSDDEIVMPSEEESGNETADFVEYSDMDDNMRAENRRKKAAYKKKKAARQKEAEQSSSESTPVHRPSRTVTEQFSNVSATSNQTAAEQERRAVGISEGVRSLLKEAETQASIHLTKLQSNQTNRWDEEEPSDRDGGERSQTVEQVELQPTQQRPPATRSVFAPRRVPEEVYNQPQQQHQQAEQQVQPMQQQHQNPHDRPYDAYQQQMLQQQQAPPTAAKRGIGQMNRWDADESDDEQAEERPQQLQQQSKQDLQQVQQPQGQYDSQPQQQPNHDEQQSVPGSLSGQSQSSHPLGDSTVQHVPMNPQQPMQQQQQPYYAAGPQYAQGPGQPGPFGPPPPGQPAYAWAYNDPARPEMGYYWYQIDPAFLGYQQQPPMQPTQQPGYGPTAYHGAVPGHSGAHGPPGHSGAQGPPGHSGAHGPPGHSGAHGPPGHSGVPGPRGPLSQASSTTKKRVAQQQRDGLEEAFRERQERYFAPARPQQRPAPAAAPAAPRNNRYYEDEGDDLARAHISQCDTARRRIRWQVISILKNMQNKNEQRLRHGKEEKFELIEMTSLAEMISMGCGDELELYQATQELNTKGDDLFLNFVRDMEIDGLCKLYRIRSVDKFRNTVVTKYHKNIVYVMDPHLLPPARLDLIEYR